MKNLKKVNEIQNKNIEEEINNKEMPQIREMIQKSNYFFSISKSSDQADDDVSGLEREA